MRIAEPMRSEARFVARNLRLSDQQELMAAEGRDPFDACMDAFRVSDECIAIVGDDERVVGLAGVNGHYIWMLGTDELTSTESHRRQLAAGARRWINAVVQDIRASKGQVLLHNWVHAKNIDSIRWLKSLGFTVHEPEPHGPSLQLFCYFSMRA
jgi:hypothetical protein